MLPRQKYHEISVLGTWEIVSCESCDDVYENLSGVRFSLDEGDDIQWFLTPQADQNFPLFSCKTFEFVDLTEGRVLHFYLLNAENWIEFKVSFHHNHLVLKSGRNLKLTCKSITDTKIRSLLPLYTLLNALEEGYFSDLTLSASSGEKFEVHKTVLSRMCPNEGWDTIPAYLRGHPVDVLRVILHYLYTGCLLEGLSENAIKGTLKAIDGVPSFKGLVKLCTDVLEATAVITKINTLLNDVVQAVDCVVSDISGLCTLSHDGVSRLSVATGPIQLRDSSKKLLQQSTVAFLKLVLLCDVFSRRKNELTRQERHNIIASVRDRLCGLVNQVHSLLVICRDCLMQMTETQKQDIATHLIPEIENTWKVASQIGMNTRETLDDIVEKEGTEQKTKRHTTLGDKLSRTLNNAIHIRQLKVLKRIQEETTAIFIFLFQKREDFSVMTPERKQNSLVKTMNNFTEEIPDLIRRLEMFPQVLDNKLKFKDWKSVFKVGTARVSLMLEKLRQNKAALKPSVTSLCELVQHKPCLCLLEDLKLIDPGSPLASSTAQQAPPVPRQKPEQYHAHPSSPSCSTAGTSLLARAVAGLLTSGEYADMTFIVSSCPLREGGCQVCKREADNKTSAETSNQACNDMEQGTGESVGAQKICDQVCQAKCEEDDGLISQAITGHELVEIKAHRVILATRCQWFKCALLSGMKESINRKISVPDTNPVLFHKFLESLYLGTMDTHSMSMDQLAEMMILTDIYEMDSMKEDCEAVLCTCITDDSALYLLSIADRYNAQELKKTCIRFITCNPGVLHSEEYYELTPELQKVIQIQLDTRSIIQTGSQSMERDIEALSILTLEEATRKQFFVQLQPDNKETRIEKCIISLREILGSQPTRRELIRVTLAADCDVNRALNFYFSWQSNDSL